MQSKFNLLDKFIRHLRLRKIRPYFKEKKVVADLGCGDGSVLKFLSSKIKIGYGLDKNILELKEKNLYFSCQDITESLPLENERFEIVLLLAVLEHLVNPISLFKEIKRILKTEGLLILTTPTPKSQGLLEFLAFKLKLISQKEIKEHKHYYSQRELIDLLRENDLKILKMESFCFGFNTLAIAKK